MEKDYILNQNLSVRIRVASNPNTDKEVLTTLSEDQDLSVRRRVASNPNTDKEVLTTLSKDQYCSVRSSVASNPNTDKEVLTTLSKDQEWDVRSSVASNPNTDKDRKERTFSVGERYVATQGTTHMWYKHVGSEFPHYTCGCFIGSREQLISRIIYGGMYAERIQILEALDAKFNEVFNSKNNQL